MPERRFVHLAGRRTHRRAPWLRCNERCRGRSAPLTTAALAAPRAIRPGMERSRGRRLPAPAENGARGRGPRRPVHRTQDDIVRTTVGHSTADRRYAFVQSTSCSGGRRAHTASMCRRAGHCVDPSQVAASPGVDGQTNSGAARTGLRGSMSRPTTPSRYCVHRDFTDDRYSPSCHYRGGRSPCTTHRLYGTFCFRERAAPDPELGADWAGSGAASQANGPYQLTWSNQSTVPYWRPRRRWPRRSNHRARLHARGWRDGNRTAGSGSMTPAGPKRCSSGRGTRRPEPRSPGSRIDSSLRWAAGSTTVPRRRRRSA